MSVTPGRGHEALRRGRWSSAGAEYFLTICTAERTTGLEGATMLPLVLGQAHCLTTDGVWHLRTAVVMPDHIHLLVTLGDHVSLGGAVRLFKGPLTAALQTHNIRWQPSYFEHRLRVSEDRLPVFLNVFLNPYRAKVVGPREPWKGYFCDADWQWFTPLTDGSSPFPEWLA
jgi:putative transposase